MKAVILANGDYPTHEIPLRVLQEAEIVVCCDGAANEFIRRGRKPTAIVGDGDSIKPEFRHLLHRIAEQDTNDLTKAVSYLNEQGVTELVIVGATGKREDHTLGNVSLLIEYLRQGITTRLFTDYGIFIPCHNEVSFSCKVGQQVSVFNFGATELHGQGLCYPLSDFTSWWQGTLNEAMDSCFTITAHGYFMIYLPYDAEGLCGFTVWD